MRELLKIDAPVFLVVSTTLGFFALLGLLFARDLPEGTKDILQVMLGGVLGQWTTIISYFFGSSSGSARKSDMLNDIAAGTGDGSGGTVTTKAKTVTEKTVTVDTTTPAASAWATGTPYKLGDLVTVGASKFRALADHTSAVTDEPGVGNDWSGIWERQA